MDISIITYDFDRSKVAVRGPYEIVKETDKCYFYTYTEKYLGHTYHKQRKILKDRIGKIIHRKAYGGTPPYLELSMIDVNERVLREKFSGWFTDEAYKVIEQKDNL